MSNDATVVVITGASAGIGAAIARTLGGEGKRVVLAARREAELQKVADEAAALGAARTLVVRTDVTRRAEVLRLRDATLAAFGRFDVWINNAGRGITRNVIDLSDEDLDQMIAVNLKSALYGMQAAVPHFMERGTGHLINMSSSLGRVPVASFRSAYSAAKSALNSLTTNLRMDLLASHPGVHVSLVMPSIVTTGFFANVVGEPRRPMPAGAPAGGPRPQTAEDVAVAVAELIRAPRAEVFTNPASVELARQFAADMSSLPDRSRLT
jgi:NADP-dependent 3-hydroxy acid dehydrogenase YdfG